MSLFQNTFSNIKKYIPFISNKNRFRIIILFTSDVHGYVYPYDYIQDKNVECGLAKIATRVEYYRKRYDNVILFDNGDFLQGSPINYYYNYIDYQTPYPIAKIMNTMGYSVSVVGNHDIEQGPKVYNRVRKQLNFPWLSANAITQKGKSYFQPYTLRDLNIIKTAILGLTTPAIPLWVNPGTYRGIEWQDMEEAAAGWAKFFKEKKKADLLIGLFHAGIHPNSQRPEWPKDMPEENPCLKIAKKHPEYDIIIAGHEHDTYNSHPRERKHRIDEPLVVMAGSHGCSLGAIHLVYQQENGKCIMEEKYAELDSLKDVKPHPEIMELFKPYHETILDYIQSVIGESASDISSRHARFKDNAFVDLIHQVQLDATTAEISLATAFTTNYTVKKGPIRIKDVYGLYRYENNLYVILMSGQQIKEHLENCAQYFNKIDPENPFRIPLVNKEFKGFNYDTAEGVNYEIDVTKPVGKRITKLEDTKTGNALNPKQTYKVAVNSYRGTQLQKQYGCRIIWKSNKELRDLLVEYIQKVKKIHNIYSSNWHLVPEDLVRLILDYETETK